MKVHSIKFIVEKEPTDPSPTGTYQQIAQQIWDILKQRQASTWRVKELLVNDYSDQTEPQYCIEAVGMEIWNPVP